MNERQVTEFIVVPPLALKDAVARAKERLSHHLTSRFPGYAFKISAFVPVGDADAFFVMPVMNFLGDDGKSYMCSRPSRWLLNDIAAACAAFDLRSRSCAA